MPRLEHECNMRAQAKPNGNQTKCRTVIQAHHTEVIASCSELLSLHCLRHQLFLALLPALGDLLVIMRQDCSAYAEEPLRTVGLLEAAHQYSLQDVHDLQAFPSHHTPYKGESVLRPVISITGRGRRHGGIAIAYPTDTVVTTATSQAGGCKS